MLVGVFYLSHAPGAGRQRIKLPGGGSVFVRVELVESPDEGAALDDAQCHADETLMNTHRVWRCA